MRKRLAEQELAEKTKQSDHDQRTEAEQSSHNATHNTDQNNLAAVTNLMVIVGFAFFAYAVKYVISTIND